LKGHLEQDAEKNNDDEVRCPATPTEPALISGDKSMATTRT